MDETLGDNKKSIAYILWGVLAISLLTFLCFYKRIKLAVAILKTGASYLG